MLPASALHQQSWTWLLWLASFTQSQHTGPLRQFQGLKRGVISLKQGVGSDTTDEERGHTIPTAMYGWQA